MSTQDFSGVDFTNLEVRRSLARAYAVVMRIKVEETKECTAGPERVREQEEAARSPKRDKRPREKRANSNRRELVQQFRQLFLSGSPETHSKMQQPGAAAKYYKRFHSLTDEEIAAHLAGRATFAAPLIGKDGFTREVALDIDEGGERAIAAGLQVAAELGYSAYGLVSQAVVGGHDGGHIRIPFADVAAPERARLLGEQLQQAVIVRCGLPEKVVEVYPTHKGLRLPFGVHTYTKKRGTLLLQDGTRLELDEGEPLSTIGQAMNLLEVLPPNNPDMLPLLPAAPVSHTPVSPPNGPGRPKSGSPIQDYNQRINLLDWLVSIGGRLAGSTRGGGYLLHCPCSNHKHQDARPSLELQPARNPRRGAYVLIGHAPGCLFATERGRIIDAFDAYCRWYGVSIRDAVGRLRNAQ